MRLLCLAAAAAGLLGCGPIDYLYTVGVKATRSVAEAKAAGAEKLAPYEYWSAVEYLQMARETASYADYQLSSRYGEKAVKMGDDARKLAVERRDAPAPSAGGEESPPDLQKGKGETP